MQKTVTYIIVNYNIKEDVIKCIDSIHLYSKDINYEIVLVDNYSKDGSLEYFSKRNDIKYIYNKVNYGFGKANNIGVENALGSIIVFANPDTVLTSNTNISKLIAHFEDKKIGLLSCNIYYGNGNIQSDGEHFPSLAYSVLLNIFFWNYKPIRKIRSYFSGKSLKNVDWITGAFFICKKEVFDSVGGFDENIFLNAEDIDIGARIKGAGYFNKVDRSCSIIHNHGVSKKKTGFHKSLDDYKKTLKTYEYVLVKNNLTQFPKLIIKLKIINYRLYNFLIKLR